MIALLFIFGICASAHKFIELEDPALAAYQHFFPSWYDSVLAAEANGGYAQWPVNPFNSPMRGTGAPGLMAFDYDLDGDIDVYVANSAGHNNSLFQNQFAQTGQVSFIDVAVDAGVALPTFTTMGVCGADVDNDGDIDMLVTNARDPIVYFVNNGDGTFLDKPFATQQAGLTEYECSFGDVDGDGFVDATVSRAIDPVSAAALFFVPFALNQHNSLYMNLGNDPAKLNMFADETVERGLGDALHNITWASAMIDIDADGDLDILFANDFGVLRGFGRGQITTYLNNGSGYFTDETLSFAWGPSFEGGHMGFGYGDFNCDGLLDILDSNGGPYITTITANKPPNRDGSTAIWSGTFDGRVELVWPLNTTNPSSSPFAWGNAVFDRENDGDLDFFFFGGLNAMPVFYELSNGGVAMENVGCSFEFVRDLEAMPLGTYTRRPVSGVVRADFNDDGFVDFMTVSDVTLHPNSPIQLFTDVGTQSDPMFDADASFLVMFNQTNGAFIGEPESPGGVYLHLNDPQGSNAQNNHFAKIKVVGAKNLSTAGKENRLGIGAFVFVRPEDGNQTMQPIVGGDSYGSQSDLSELVFGLGAANKAVVDVEWPHLIWNSRSVKKDETVYIPELQCSYRAFAGDFAGFKACLNNNLSDLVASGILSTSDANKYKADMKKAYNNYHHPS